MYTPTLPSTKSLTKFTDEPRAGAAHTPRPSQSAADAAIGNDEENDDADDAEPRDKDKKDHGAYVMIPLMLASILVPIAYGALAALAGKALIVSKLALVLASIIGVKKLLSKGHGGSSHDVVMTSEPHDRIGWPASVPPQQLLHRQLRAFDVSRKY